MTLKELYEKLELNENNGTSALFKVWLDSKFRSDYDALRGFIWGLYASDYITKKEKDELLEELLKELINKKE